MCQNNSGLYFKFALAAVISIILGVLAGATLPAFPALPVRFLAIELITSAVVLIISAVYLLMKQGKICQCMAAIKYYIVFLVSGAAGGFITSVIGLSSIITAELSSAILLGFAVGFFALIIFGIIFIYGYLLYTLSDN